MVKMRFLLCFAFSLILCQSEGSDPPKMLSSLYGYNDCIGGVNNFDTEEEYLEELKRRNCTVENGRTNVTNVVSSTMISLRCFAWFNPLSWLDGMPVVFNYPLDGTPSYDDFEVELSDGTKITPDCILLGPADEQNELDTALLLGQFGDGPLDTLKPVRVTVVGDVNVVNDEGVLVNAKGVTYSNDVDMNYVSSTVRLVTAKMWDVNVLPEDFHYPLWPLPSQVKYLLIIYTCLTFCSQVYPNDCVSLYPNTTHVIRATFSGGVTTDGIAPIMPSNRNVFRVSRSTDSSDIVYLGLADLRCSS